ncbi:MAG: adenosylhomocysteinase [Propionicimonas sp.]
MQTRDTAGWVELVVRRYARQTNRLIAGRSFAVTGAGAHADALGGALQAMGARVVDPAAEHVDACFDADPGNLDAALTASYLPEPRETAAARIAWARHHMPVVNALGRELAASGLLAGRRVGICLVLEPKTAVLARVLAGAGATVSLYAHPEETDEQVAAELRAGGIPVFGGAAAAQSALAEQDRFLGQRLHLLIDDGSRLIRRLIDSPKAASELIGAAEETTSGLRPLRERGDLPFPVVAVNDARTKLCFDNAHGTGQSCLLTILDLIDPDGAAWLHGRNVAVAGFGPVGEGFCRHARALGAEVVVADPDPMAELRARFAGYRTGPLEQLVADADLVVSASGYPHTITLGVMEACRAGAVIAVAGGVEDEVDWRLAVEAGATLEPVSPWVEDLVRPSGGSVRLLDRGGCINCTAGEGNPIEIMDLSFAVQLAALELLLTQHLSPGLHAVPAAADEQIALLTLDRTREP